MTKGIDDHLMLTVVGIGFIQIEVEQIVEDEIQLSADVPPYITDAVFVQNKVVVADQTHSEL